MTNTNPTETHTEILNLINAYAVHGGDAASSVTLARKLRDATVLALSIDFVRRANASYRIATLEDGTTWLVCRYRRQGAPWIPVFSCDRLRHLVGMGWKVAS